MIFETGETTKTIWQMRRGIFLLHTAMLILCFAITCVPQTNISRQQFARFDVLTRASYFEKEILRAANEEGVDPNILWTIAYNETRFRPWLTSPKNAQGMMQFIPATAARFDLADPYKAVPSIKAAARYVKYLSKMFGGRVDSILAAYNSGEGTVSAYLSGRSLRNGSKTINSKGIKTIGGVPPYAETIRYVGQGIKTYSWLVKRQTFPLSIARAKFPSIMSSAVASVRHFDNELGNILDFNILPLPLPQSKPNQVSTKANGSWEPTSRYEESNSQAPRFTEVYYDSRSGKRYFVNGGKMQELPDSGAVVINNNSRPETTNEARSTFFAVPSN